MSSGDQFLMSLFQKLYKNPIFCAVFVRNFGLFTQREINIPGTFRVLPELSPNQKNDSVSRTGAEQSSVNLNSHPPLEEGKMAFTNRQNFESLLWESNFGSYGLRNLLNFEDLHNKVIQGFLKVDRIWTFSVKPDAVFCPERFAISV
jgi:hypothetical protein